MGMGEYIGFLTGVPTILVPLFIFLISVAIEIVLLFAFPCTKNRLKTVYTIAGANLFYVFVSEVIFKVLYGTWFTSIYRMGKTDFYGRLICSLVIIYTLGNVLLKKEMISIQKFNIMLGIGIVASAIISLWIVWFFR